MLMPLLVILVRIIAVYDTNFTVASIRPQDANILFEVGIVLIPYITLGFSLYGILSIMSGEMTLYETFSTLAYSLVPLVILWPILTLLSSVVSNGEVSIFHAAQMLLYVWIASQIVVAINQMNSISMRKTVGVCALSVLGVAVILVTALLLFAFTSQLVYFCMEISNEVNGLSL